MIVSTIKDFIVHTPKGHVGRSFTIVSSTKTKVKNNLMKVDFIINSIYAAFDVFGKTDNVKYLVK